MATPRPATRCSSLRPAPPKRAAAPRIADAADPRLAAFADALHDLLKELAILVAKDGEGLTKFVTVEVEGAENDAAARRIGLSIANSPLVKTAIAGEDPNWGRVVMAVGKAGEAADRDRLSIWFGDILVAKDGERAPTYVEETVARLHEGRRRSRCASTSASAAAAPPSGPAT